MSHRCCRGNRWRVARLFAVLVVILSLVGETGSRAQESPDSAAPAPVITWQFGPSHAVASVALSPGGKRVATLSGNGTALLWNVVTGLWDMTTGRGTYALQGPQRETVLRMSFSPDGKKLATGGWVTKRPPRTSGVDYQYSWVALWDTTTGQSHHTFVWPEGEPSALPAGPASPPGGSDFDSGAPSRQMTLTRGSKVTAMVFSPDGKTLAVGSEDGAVKLWEVESGQPMRTLEGSPGGVHTMAFSPDGKTLATMGEDGTVVLRDTDTWQTLRTLAGDRGDPEAVERLQRELKEALEEVNQAAEEAVLGGADEEKVRRLLQGLEKELEEMMKTLRDGPPTHNLLPLAEMSFSPDGQTLATASVYENPEKEGGVHIPEEPGFPFRIVWRRIGEVKLWDVTTGQPGRASTWPAVDVRSLVFSPDGKTLAAAMEQGTVKLWDVDTEKEKGTLAHGAAVHSMGFSLDGKALATGGQDGAVRLWNVP